MNLEEDRLKHKLVQYISDDFLIRKEVRGVHLIGRTGVSIDFLLYPKQHLIDDGFDSEWIGLEAKYIKDFKNGDLGKKSKLVWQSITCAQPVFEVDGARVRPFFILMYVGEEDFSKDEFGERAAVSWGALVNLAQYANVGWMITSPRYGWVIRFGGGTYYRNGRGQGNVTLSSRNRVGSIC